MSDDDQLIICPLFSLSFSYIRRIGENGDWTSSGYEDLITPDNRTNITVTNLQPFTVYSFRITAVNALGQSIPSKESYQTVTLRESKFLSYLSHLFPLLRLLTFMCLLNTVITACSSTFSTPLCLALFILLTFFYHYAT